MFFFTPMLRIYTSLRKNFCLFTFVFLMSFKNYKAAENNEKLKKNEQVQNYVSEAGSTPNHVNNVTFSGTNSFQDKENDAISSAMREGNVKKISQLFERNKTSEESKRKDLKLKKIPATIFGRLQKEDEVNPNDESI